MAGLAEEEIASGAAAAAASAAASSAAAADEGGKGAGGGGGGKLKNKKFKGVFKALKGELAQIKERWGANAKIYFKRPPPPWPVKALRILPKAVRDY